MTRHPALAGYAPVPAEYVGMAPPKFATPRDFTRATRGTEQVAVARDFLGVEAMPAQRYILDVAGELDAAGMPVYPLVIVTAPRRAGKTFIAMARKCHLCLTKPGAFSWYTAQSGGDARDGFLGLKEVIDAAPIARLMLPTVRPDGTAVEVPAVETLVGNGREVMRFANGSTMRPHPPSETALHGKKSDDNDIDEAWAFDALEGAALMQAVGPTQLTRPGAQTWIWSAGGTAASTWLAELVARGRAGEPGIAFFEWGIPDDADPEDLDLVAACHPAVGYTVSRQSLEALRKTFGDDVAGWARAAGNRWTEVIGSEIPADLWKRLRHLEAIPAVARVAYGAARAADGSEVAIVAAAEVGDAVVVDVLEVLPTAHRAADHVLAWARGGPLAVARQGPSAGLAADLEKKAPKRVTVLTPAQESAAVIGLLDAMELEGVKFRPHPALDRAQEVAGTRITGDGGKAWARTKSGGSIAALDAATAAVYALAHAPKPVGAPRVLVAR